LPPVSGPGSVLQGAGIRGCERRLEPGQVLKVLATDRGSLADIPAWADANGDELLESAEEGGVFVYYVRKAPGA
jgi:TusA-related sulfurtransferase